MERIFNENETNGLICPCPNPAGSAAARALRQKRREIAFGFFPADSGFGFRVLGTVPVNWFITVLFIPCVRVVVLHHE